MVLNFIGDIYLYYAVGLGFINAFYVYFFIPFLITAILSDLEIEYPYKEKVNSLLKKFTLKTTMIVLLSPILFFVIYHLLINRSVPKDDENDYYEEIKKDIFNGKFKFLSYDDDNNIIYLKRYSDQFPVTVKISFYKNDKLNSFENEINNDSLFSYLLSDLVLSKKTKHINKHTPNLTLN
jgi:hypothetical protein